MVTLLYLQFSCHASRLWVRPGVCSPECPQKRCDIEWFNLMSPVDLKDRSEKGITKLGPTLGTWGVGIWWVTWSLWAMGWKKMVSPSLPSLRVVKTVCKKQVLNKHIYHFWKSPLPLPFDFISFISPFLYTIFILQKYVNFTNIKISREAIWNGNWKYFKIYCSVEVVSSPFRNLHKKLQSYFLKAQKKILFCLPRAPYSVFIINTKLFCKLHFT